MKNLEMTCREGKLTKLGNEESEMKTLYFESVGGEFYQEEQTSQSDIGNHRIRTSFLNNDGKQFFIDLGCGYRRNEKGKNTGEMFVHIDFIFDVNSKPLNDVNRVNYTEYKPDIHEMRAMDYTKENIVKWINENLNCNFDNMELLNSFYGYRVHGDNQTYNLMESIELYHERAEERKAAYDKIDSEYRIKLNEKYSMIGMNEMDSESITIRCHATDQALEKAGLERVVRLPIECGKVVAK